jgi:hypothetical protein
MTIKHTITSFHLCGCIGTRLGVVVYLYDNSKHNTASVNRQATCMTSRDPFIKA